MPENRFSEDELNILRILRSRPHRESFHVIASSLGLKFDEAKVIFDKLISSGYIQQDKRDRDKFLPVSTYFTCADKRAEIDELLLQDIEKSVIKLEDVDCINADIDDKSYVCLNCQTVYKTKVKICKNCLEGVVEIDTNILDIIVELNRKGYQTQFCCSGHTNSPAYIYMIGGIDFENIPDGFVKERKARDYHTIIRAEVFEKRLKKKIKATLTKEEIVAFIKSDMQKLREWVRMLPAK